MLKENVVFFPKESLWTGKKTDYELVLTAPSKNKSKGYFRNENGTIIKIKPKGDFVIKYVNKYKIEDIIRYKNTGENMFFKDLIKFFAKRNKLTCVLTVINNKLVCEYFENELMDLFILKNPDSAYLLCETIKQFNNINGISNFIYFQDPSLDGKKRIYDLLEERYEIDRDYMQKISTH